MLKIKDDLELKELEKFGFNYNKIENEYEYEEDNEKIGIPKNKYIYLEYLGKGFVGNIIEEKSIDILYDLIQAGLVEKIEGE